MMTDDELDALLARARQGWRVPPPVPVDEMWSAVADTVRDAPRRTSPGWMTVGVAAAAALVIGGIGGRYWPRPDVAARAPVPATQHVPAVVPATSDRADQAAMGDLLGRTTALLADLPMDSTTQSLDPRITREGTRLLTRTRLLLDSPLATDARLRGLLQDLELVLAQVARLEPQHPHAEMQFIRTALNEHDLVPRLRSAAADLSHDDF